MAELGPEYIQYKDLITNDGITLEFLKWIVENGQFEMFSDEYSDQYIVNLQHKSVFRDHIIDILSPRVSGERFGESVQMRLEHEFELFRVNGPTLVLLSLFIPFSYNSFPSPPTFIFILSVVIMMRMMIIVMTSLFIFSIFPSLPLYLTRPLVFSFFVIFTYIYL